MPKWKPVDYDGLSNRIRGLYDEFVGAYEKYSALGKSLVEAADLDWLMKNPTGVRGKYCSYKVNQGKGVLEWVWAKNPKKMRGSHKTIGKSTPTDSQTAGQTDDEFRELKLTAKEKAQYSHGDIFYPGRIGGFWIVKITDGVATGIQLFSEGELRKIQDTFPIVEGIDPDSDPSGRFSLRCRLHAICYKNLGPELAALIIDHAGHYAEALRREYDRRSGDRKGGEKPPSAVQTRRSAARVG